MEHHRSGFGSGSFGRELRKHSPNRVLYFFHGQNVAILGHGLIKEGAVPPAEIERVIRRKQAFVADPQSHTFEGELDHA